MGSVFGIISLVVGAAGAGLQYSASMSAANTAAQFARLNAESGVQMATQQANQASLQSQLQAAQSQTAAEAAGDNAEAARQQAEQDNLIEHENIRRSRDEFARKLGQANAQAGGSGVSVATASPLDFLTRAAEEENMLSVDANFIAGNNRSGALRRAAAIGLGGRVEGLNSTLHTLAGDSALAEGRMRAAQARLDGMAGVARAAGARSAAFGGLVGGLGGLATQGYQMFRKTPTAS